jgi:hypothetical protein
MDDLTDLEQMVDHARAYAYQARYHAWAARMRAAHRTQEVQHASHRASIAYLRRSMPEANPLTLAITATLLADHGLLDEQPTLRPRRPATGGR